MLRVAGLVLLLRDWISVHKRGMSGKASLLFQGKRANKKGIVEGVLVGKTAGGSVKLGALSVRQTIEGDGKHAFVVELRLGGSSKGSDLPSPRCKKFSCDGNGFDDAKACARAYSFAVATDEVPIFRTFLLEEGLGCEDGSTQDIDRSAMTGFLRSSASGLELSDASEYPVDQFPATGRVCGGLERKETWERKPVSYVCLRKNRRLGLIFAVVMARLENRVQRSRSISFQMQRRNEDDDYVVGEEELLNRAITFLRSAAFEDWRKNGGNRSLSQGDHSGPQRHKRGLKHPFSHVGIEDGEKVDCSCGKNWSKGLMVACEQCGVWEHAECLGYKSSSQIPADYVCSACIRAQKEEVVFIRLEEQETGQVQYSDHLLIDSKEKERLENEAACCVCGCEDNEDFENMSSSCLCGDTLSFTHPSCLSSASESTTVKEQLKQGSSSPCLICGGQGSGTSGNNGTIYSSESGKEKSPLKQTSLKRNTRRPSNPEHSSKKRLRSGLLQTGSEKHAELAENSLPSSLKRDAEVHAGKKADNLPAESMKPEATVLGRKFADAAVTVPIKKRRLQLMEAIHPPSPPRSPSPSHQSGVAVLKDATTKELSGNPNNDEFKSMQDGAIAGSVVFEDERKILTSKNLEVGSCSLKGEATFSKDLLDDGKEGKEKLEESFISKEAVAVAAEISPAKEEMQGIASESLESLSGTDEMQCCSSFIKEEEEAKPSVPLTAPVLEASRFDPMSEMSPLLSPKQELESECGMVENESQSKALISNAPEDLYKVEQELIITVGSLEVSPMTKDELQSGHNQSLEASNHGSGLVRSRGDRSHWDLNMEMEAWEQPCADTTDADAALDKAEASCPTSTLDSAEDRGASPLAENEDVANSNSDTKDSCPEDIQEKTTLASTTSPEDLSASVSPVGSMPSETTRVDPDFLPAMMIGNSDFSSDFNQLKSSSQQCVDQDGEAEDGSKADIDEPANASIILDPPQDGSPFSENGSDANAIASVAVEVEETTKSEMVENMTSGVPILVDTSDPVSWPNGAREITQEESEGHLEDDSKVDYDYGTSPADFRHLSETGERMDLMESEAFEEDEEDGISPGSLHDSYDRDGDNERELGERRPSDWDGDLVDDLEAEDVDYGDSENEDEQGNRDGGIYGLEADEVASAGSQEEREFEDNVGEREFEDNAGDAGDDFGEQGPSLGWVDFTDHQTEEVGDRDQYPSDMDIAVPNSCEPEDSRAAPCPVDQRETVDPKDSQQLVENPENGEEGMKHGKDNQSVSSKRTSAVTRAKSSGWDQLPEGFEKAEDALRAVKENLIRGGRSLPRGGFLSSAGSRGPPFELDSRLAERGRTDVSGRSRDFGRGRSRGRSGSSVVLRERSRIDPWVNGAADGPPGQWAPKRHPSPPGRFRDGPGFGQHRQTNAAAIAAAKLENSGFVVAPDGTITKAGSAGANLLRGAPRPFPCGGRSSGGGSFFSSGRGSAGMSEMNLGARVGRGPGGAFGFGPGMRGNMGMHPPGLRVGGPGRPGIGNRGMIDRYRIPPHSAAHFGGEQSFVNRPVAEHPEKWGRRPRHLSPPLKFGRSSPPFRSHRRSRSKSRTRSPRLRTPPRSGNVSGGSSSRRSRSPMLRSVVKGESRESSPAGHRSIPPPPKLPLPPPPPRGQRSPPAGLKRLSEKREGDRKYTDVEPVRSTGQSHISPRRLASHIELTSALSDEPNETVSSFRQSSVTDKDKSSSSLGHISRLGPNRDFGPLDSFGRSNSEVHRSSDDEFRDGVTHAVRKSEPRLKDVIWGGRDQRADADFYRRKLGRDESRREVFRSTRAGRGGSNF